jgi:hypothetical protein
VVVGSGALLGRLFSNFVKVLVQRSPASRMNATIVTTHYQRPIASERARALPFDGILARIVTEYPPAVVLFLSSDNQVYLLSGCVPRQSRTERIHLGLVGTQSLLDDLSSLICSDRHAGFA